MTDRIRLSSTWEQMSAPTEQLKAVMKEEDPLWTKYGTRVKLSAVGEDVVLGFDPLPHALPLLEKVRGALEKDVPTFSVVKLALKRGDDLYWDPNRMEKLEDFKSEVQGIIGDLASYCDDWRTNLGDCPGIKPHPKAPSKDLSPIDGSKRVGQVSCSDFCNSLQLWRTFVPNFIESVQASIDELIRRLELNDRIWLADNLIAFPSFRKLIEWEKKSFPDPEVVLSKDVFPFRWNASPPVYGVDVSEFSVCSYNMKDFAGLSGIRYTDEYRKVTLPTIVKHLKQFDLIVLQELKAPLVTGRYSYSNVPYNPNTVTSLFHELMIKEGYVLSQSQDKTGTMLANIVQPNAKGAEFFALYFRAEKMRVEASGFISSEIAGREAALKRTHNYTPYAWFVAPNSSRKGFICLAVHFNPSTDLAGTKYRQHEMEHISSWLSNFDGQRFVIAGDFNLQNLKELDDLLQNTNLISANGQCVSTNLLRTKPYDHFVFAAAAASHSSVSAGFSVKAFQVHHFMQAPVVADSMKWSDHCPVNAVVHL